MEKGFNYVEGAQIGMFDMPDMVNIGLHGDSTKDIINLRDELRGIVPNTTYVTHAIHNVYPAKFIPQVPRFVIERFDLKGKIIFDPFAGSGTTAVESLITGNSNISNDINPITKFLVEIKTLKLRPQDYYTYVDRITFHINSMSKSNLRFVPRWGNLTYWYPSDILEELIKIWGYIHNMDENESDVKCILSAGALCVSRKYSYGEDESPKLFKSKHKAIKMQGLTRRFREFGKDLLLTDLSKKAKQYLECIIQFNVHMKTVYKKVDSLNDTNGQFLMVLNNSIEELSNILPGGMIDCIITSPPYIYAQEYLRSAKLDMYWLNMVDDASVRELTKKEIGQKPRPFRNLSAELSKIAPYKNTLHDVKKLSNNFKTKGNILRFEAYFNDMLYFVRLASNLLIGKGILAIFIGEPRVFGAPVNVKNIISEIMVKNNFKMIHTFFDVIKSRHLSRNRLNKNPNGISGEWLIVGEKT